MLSLFLPFVEVAIMWLLLFSLIMTAQQSADLSFSFTFFFSATAIFVVALICLIVVGGELLLLKALLLTVCCGLISSSSAVVATFQSAHTVFNELAFCWCWKLRETRSLRFYLCWVGGGLCSRFTLLHTLLLLAGGVGLDEPCRLGSKIGFNSMLGK